MRRIKRWQAPWREWCQVDATGSTIHDQFAHCLAGRGRIEHAPDTVAGRHVGAVNTRHGADNGKAIFGDRPEARLPRFDAARQAEIWAEVRETQQQLSRSVGTPVAATTSPSSLQLSLENAKLREAQAAYFDALGSAGESADDIVGYVFAINGKITGGDVYASSALFRKMFRKLLIANITQAISEKNGTRASPPSLDDVQAFLTAVDSAPPSERALNSSVRLATGGGDHYLSTEIKRADGGWVHRNYLAR